MCGSMRKSKLTGRLAWRPAGKATARSRASASTSTEPSQSGDDAKADDYFRRLTEFYPQFAFLGDFLREYDISSMINLKEFA